MLDEKGRVRFQELRRREMQHILTRAEEAELSALLQELDAAEAASLSPATERLWREREELQQQNATLQELIARREALVSRLRATLDELHATR